MRWAIACLVAACRFSPGIAPPGDGTLGGEGDTDATLGTGPWGAPMLVASLAGTSKDDPSLTADLLEMYFNACPTDCELYVTTRATATAPWSPPELVRELNSTVLESTPRVSPDGLSIYFTSVRTGGPGSDDVYRAVRATRASAWGAPVLVAELSLGSSDYGTSPDPNGTRLVFNTDRAPSQGQDLWETTRAPFGATWDPPARIANVNSSGPDLSACLSADDLTLYFHSSRSGNDELYMATRAAVGSPFSAPQPIAELSSPNNEDDPWVSPDGHTMFFASDRVALGTLQIYEAHR